MTNEAEPDWSSSFFVAFANQLPLELTRTSEPSVSLLTSSDVILNNEQ